MDRRLLIASGLASLAAGRAAGQDAPAPTTASAGGPQPGPAPTYSTDEIVGRVSDFMGVTAESAGAVVERIFKD
ncbi:MAG: DUF1134 domain-containing protein, partial [Caulobacteraceae bacterium]|nr:DUF1134 domain-containing protein [Caulobacteraceae bacterium]